MIRRFFFVIVEHGEIVVIVGILCTAREEVVKEGTRTGVVVPKEFHETCPFYMWCGIFQN